MAALDFRVRGRHFQPVPPGVVRHDGRASPRPHQQQQPRRAVYDLKAGLVDHLTRVVGLPADVSEVYAANLVAEGCDSVRSFDDLSPHELKEDFGWKKFHVKKFEAYAKFWAEGSESPNYFSETALATDALEAPRPAVPAQVARPLYRDAPGHDPEAAALHADPRVAEQSPARLARDVDPQAEGRPVYRAPADDDRAPLAAAEARREAMVRRFEKQAQRNDAATVAPWENKDAALDVHGLDTLKKAPLGTSSDNRDSDEDSLLGFELRVDDTDGIAYPYESFAALYGTSQAPAIWEAAEVALSYNPDDFRASPPPTAVLHQYLESAEAEIDQQLNSAALLQERQERKREQIAEAAREREEEYRRSKGSRSEPEPEPDFQPEPEPEPELQPRLQPSLSHQLHQQMDAVPTVQRAEGIQRGRLVHSAAQKRASQCRQVAQILKASIKGKRSLYGQQLSAPIDIFRAIDKDRSGDLDAAELKNGLHRLGLGLTAEQLDALVTVIDANGDGVVSSSEFVEFVDNPDACVQHFNEQQQPPPPPQQQQQPGVGAEAAVAPTPPANRYAKPWQKHHPSSPKKKPAAPEKDAPWGLAAEIAAGRGGSLVVGQPPAGIKDSTGGGGGGCSSSMASNRGKPKKKKPRKRLAPPNSGRGTPRGTGRTPDILLALSPSQVRSAATAELNANTVLSARYGENATLFGTGWHDTATARGERHAYLPRTSQPSLMVHHPMPDLTNRRSELVMALDTWGEKGLQKQQQYREHRRRMRKKATEDERKKTKTEIDQHMQQHYQEASQKTVEIFGEKVTAAEVMAEQQRVEEAEKERKHQLERQKDVFRCAHEDAEEAIVEELLAVALTQAVTAWNVEVRKWQDEQRMQEHVRSVLDSMVCDLEAKEMASKELQCVELAREAADEQQQLESRLQAVTMSDGCWAVPWPLDDGEDQGATDFRVRSGSRVPELVGDDRTWAQVPGAKRAFARSILTAVVDDAVLPNASARVMRRRRKRLQRMVAGKSLLPAAGAPSAQLRPFDPAQFSSSTSLIAKECTQCKKVKRGRPDPGRPSQWYCYPCWEVQLNADTKNQWALDTNWEPPEGDYIDPVLVGARVLAPSMARTSSPVNEMLPPPPKTIGNCSECGQQNIAGQCDADDDSVFFCHPCWKEWDQEQAISALWVEIEGLNAARVKAEKSGDKEEAARLDALANDALGRLAMVDYGDVEADISATEEWAATRIQARYRGRKARRSTAQLLLQKNAEATARKSTREAQRRKTLRALGLRMGLRLRVGGKEAFEREFMRHDTDRNGLVDREEFKAYLIDVKEWGRDPLISDVHWAESWPTVCELLGEQDPEAGISLERFINYSSGATARQL